MLQEISVIPGRVRIKNSNFYYNNPLAKYITTYTSNLYGVKYSSVNYFTGAMLIEFEPDKIEYTLLMQNIESAIYSAIKNGVEDLARYDAYYNALEKRDSARRRFVIWGGVYLLIKIKHLLFGKYSLGRDVRIVAIASAVSIVAAYPWFNRLYAKLRWHRWT